MEPNQQQAGVQQVDVQQALAYHAARQTAALGSIKIAVWILAAVALLALTLYLFFRAVGL